MESEINKKNKILLDKLCELDRNSMNDNFFNTNRTINNNQREVLY